MLTVFVGFRFGIRWRSCLSIFVGLLSVRLLLCRFIGLLVFVIVSGSTSHSLLSPPSDTNPPPSNRSHWQSQSHPPTHPLSPTYQSTPKLSPTPADTISNLSSNHVPLTVTNSLYLKSRGICPSVRLVIMGLSLCVWVVSFNLFMGYFFIILWGGYL